MRRILSLFDFSGMWALPFAEAGWDVIQVDLKHGDDISDFTCENIIERYLDGGTIDGVLLAPPCTDFTGSGARWWDMKDKDGRTEAALFLVMQGIRTVEFTRPDFWALENPPGRLEKLVPFLKVCKKFSFDPCDFAGHLQATDQEAQALWIINEKAKRSRWDQISTADAELTKRLNRYTKKTTLWGHFPDLVKHRREPIKVCAAGSWLMRLGGKSEKTKENRSDTPEGFARAFFEACQDYRLDWEAIDEDRADYPIFDSIQ